MAANAQPLPENTSLRICKFCNSEDVRECLKCKSLFCAIHAARFSPNFCKDCLTNITAIWEKYNRSTTEYDPINDTLHVVTAGAKKLQLDGADWIFYSAWINELNDDEMQVIYEFHYFVLKLIEHHNEIRKVNKAKKLASAPTPVGIVTTKETKVKKTAEVKNMQAELEKLKLPVDTIKAMLLAAGIPYKEPSA